MRKHIISRIKFAVTCVDDDYEYLKKSYKTHARKYFATYAYDFMQNPSQVQIKSNDDKINVMAGHSAFRTGRHIDTLKHLAKYKGKIRVYSPLSYGNKEYVEEVSKVGREIFGSDFIAITKYTNSKDYTEFLCKIDVAVINSNRPQGNGNIARMLYLGKKLFISPENVLYKTYRSHGAVLYLFPEEFNDENFFTPFTEEQKQACIKSIEDIYSDESFKRNWEAVFKA